MSALIMMVFTLCSTLMFPLMSQPLSLGLSIMISTFFMCSLAAMMISSWYGYILFLIYVGGLLVMFAYVAALSPNILFGRTSFLILFLVVLFPLIMIFYSYPAVDFSFFSYYSSYSSLNFMKTFGSELVSPDSVSILVGLGVILLINLVVVVKICYYQHASLRPFSHV
uniref:NADH-ubiquinone oxidoreductase chain 6 n=1 Tax=Volva habei TaxID=3079875 RepID=A0AA96ZQV2_9CAEN|nr:NADH dehydrogenase subunit 6 [Volva habei]WNX95647.1 NADH dehydrogenase subunit 6 [Volva habei]